MKKITLQHTDFDPVTNEICSDTEQGYLLTPHIVLYSGPTGFGFHCFEEAIADDQSTVKTDTSCIIDISISGASVEGINLAKLATMTVAELAKTLAAQIH
ncbi:hypothetical protein [Paenisporosarcina sp. NPDC076898]|uniref:hypothetical protein n=1 Tax=unclassified Paenisporosarcina TaxID=2642018 RepID=UPI003CFDCB1C